MYHLNYSVISNCGTAALVFNKGSIDWLYFPLTITQRKYDNIIITPLFIPLQLNQRCFFNTLSSFISYICHSKLKQVKYTMEELIEKIKNELIEELNLEEITPADIDAEAPLFGEEGLGLDSIDALEIILILERNYGIKIANPSEGKEIFYSIRTLADYITANQK